MWAEAGVSTCGPGGIRGPEAEAGGGHQRPDNYDLRSELNNHEEAREEARGLQRSQSDVGGADLRHKLNRDRRNDRKQDDGRHDDRRHDRANDERRDDRGNDDRTYDERRNDTRRSDDGRNNRRRDDRRGDRRQRNGDQGQHNRGQQHIGGGKLARPKKNTENFSPCHDPPPMRVVVATPGLARYDRTHTTRDVIIVSDLFGNPGDLGIYNKLIREIQASGVPEEQLWKLWHGDSHLIADDKRHWKELCPTFTYVVDRIRDYFDMDIKATRFNWYRNTSEWKPFHHDAAAMKPDKARSQNFTVAVSFGCEREAAFEHAETKTVVSMPQPNGTIYTFGRDVNIIWRHGILQVAPDQHREEGRVSIIAWGWVPQTEL